MFPSKALELAKLCQAAYGDAATPLGSQYAMIRRTGLDLNIAFRGTASLDQWITDAEVIPLGYEEYPGLVHHGFADAANSAWPDLYPILKMGDLRGRRIWMAGHSLGAALALLTSWQIQGAFPSQIAGIALFGCPRVGDYTFASVIGASPLPTPIRFVNHNDLVPHVPPPPLFWHVGQLCYADASGALHDRQTDTDPLALTWEDHHIEKYVAMVEGFGSQAAA